MAGSLKSQVRELYVGTSLRSVRFRYGLILFDLATVAYFIVTVPMAQTNAMRWFNLLLAVLILADFVARLWISPNRWEPKPSSTPASAARRCWAKCSIRAM
jgi:voltage-gated potassium channel